MLTAIGQSPSQSTLVGWNIQKMQEYPIYMKVHSWETRKIFQRFLFMVISRRRIISSTSRDKFSFFKGYFMSYITYTNVAELDFFTYIYILQSRKSYVYRSYY